MTLNNGERIVGLRLTSFISTVVYVLYIFFAYFPKAFRHILSENEVNILTGGVTLIYIGMLLWPTIMRFHYIGFSADEKGITLRWYKTGLMQGESKSIEIPVDRYAGYEITKHMFGLHTCLTLFQIVQNQKAGYDPVCINALSKPQRKKIIDTLNNYKSVA